MVWWVVLFSFFLAVLISRDKLTKLGLLGYNDEYNRFEFLFP